MRVKPVKHLELEQGKLNGKNAERKKAEPVSSLVPKCPSKLSKEEKSAWNYYKAILEAYGLFSGANAPMLEILATLHAEAEAISKQLKKIKIVDEDNMLNALWTVRKKNYDQMIGIYKELGLSSSGMAKLGSLVVSAKNKVKNKNEFFGD